MNRKAISVKNNRNIVLDNSFTKDLLIDGQGSFAIQVKEGVQTNLLILNVNNEDELHFDVLDNANLHVAVLAKNPANSIKITANVGQNGMFNAYLADFIPDNCKGDISVNLLGDNATFEWHLASLSQKADKKEFDVSVFHKSPRTFAQMDSYGVVRDDAKLTFSGICQIEKGSSGSKAHQNAKIMVFDALSNGVAKPILKIDENDIEASHAAVVGKINDEHIFYLTSRGLSEDEAKRIITLGYLKPILKGFNDDEMKETIEKMIEGNM